MNRVTTRLHRFNRDAELKNAAPYVFVALNLVMRFLGHPMPIATMFFTLSAYNLGCYGERLSTQNLAPVADNDL